MNLSRREREEKGSEYKLGRDYGILCCIMRKVKMVQGGTKPLLCGGSAAEAYRAFQLSQNEFISKFDLAA